METAEILHEFERVTGKFARAAVEEAVARREEVTPDLLRIPEETVNWAAQIDAEGDYMAHLYALFLLAQFRETRAYGKDRILARLADNPHRRLVSDTVAEMGWWACFREDRQNRAKSAAQAAVDSRLNPAAPSTQIKRAAPKTGRNERCPCGSGKKYKKCCGA